MPRRPRTFGQRYKADQPGPDLRLSSTARGYNSAWDRASKDWRRRFPLCEYCLKGAFGEASVTACTRVDHLYPQRRFAGVFWASQWWVSSCDACDGAKQALELGPVAGLDSLAALLGRPLLDRAGGAIET